MRNHSLCLSELFESCLEIARHPKCEGKGVLGLSAGERRDLSNLRAPVRSSIASP